MALVCLQSDLLLERFSQTCASAKLQNPDANRTTVCASVVFQNRRHNLGIDIDGFLAYDLASSTSLRRNHHAWIRRLEPRAGQRANCAGKCNASAAAPNAYLFERPQPSCHDLVA
jgi:hypothetical protein